MIKLSDVADIIVGYPFESDNFNTSADGIRLVRGMNVTTGSLRWGEDTRWWNQLSPELNDYYLKEGDIVIGMDGSRLGKNYAKVKSSDLPLLLVQRVACIRAKSGNDQDFIWSCIASDQFENYIDLVKTGTTIPHISAKQIGGYTLPKMDYAIQKKIGYVSHVINSKIEVNNEINDYLLKILTSIYYSFNPDQWETKVAENVFHIGIGKTPPRNESKWFKGTEDNNSIRWVSISDMGKSGTFINSTSEKLTKEAIDSFNIRIVPDNTVLLSFKLTVGRVAITDGEMCTNEAIAHFVSDNPHLNELLYVQLLSYDYNNLGNTSSIATAVNSKTIKDMKLKIPNDALIDEIYSQLNPIINLIRNNQREMIRLIELRDTLLPKLMSGEIDVSKVELNS